MVLVYGLVSTHYILNSTYNVNNYFKLVSLEITDKYTVQIYYMVIFALVHLILYYLIKNHNILTLLYIKKMILIYNIVSIVTPIFTIL